MWLVASRGPPYVFLVLCYSDDEKLDVAMEGSYQYYFLSLPDLTSEYCAGKTLIWGFGSGGRKEASVCQAG